MFKKWWVTLIQGILMIIIGILIFNNPKEVLAGISLWFGILTLLTGLTGVFGWVFGGKDNREGSSLIWSLLTAAFGVIILLNLLATMKVITVIFGLWVLVTGFSLLSFGWKHKSNSFLGWILVIIGVLSAIAGLSMIFNIGTGAEGVSVILGLQVILAGIALILFAFVKKMIAGKVKDKIEGIKDNFRQ